jgi:GT2 family glycosyltransferase
MLTSTQPEISLIIVNHRSVVSLERAVFSLLKIEVPKGFLEVIVANNDASEADRVLALSERFGFRVVFLTENRGFGSAGNAATREAKGKIFGFLNPDSVFECGSLSFLVEFFLKNPKVGIVGAGIVTEDGSSREEWSSGRPTNLFRVLRNKSGIFAGRRYWENRRPVSVGWVSGAALFIRRDIFERVSGFDERFFLYFEDMDLCLRVGLSGFKVVLLPSLSFRHEGGRSFSSDESKKRAYYESQDLYFSKHRPVREGVILRFLRSKFISI